MENRQNVSIGGEENLDHPKLAQNLRVAADAMNTLKQDNDRLGVENFVLRQRIELLKNNSDLKTATVLSSIISWMDEKRNKIRESTRVESPFRPATPVHAEAATRYPAAQYDPNSESQRQSPRYSQPSVRFDASRNTSRSPESFNYEMPPTTAFRRFEASQRTTSPNITSHVAFQGYEASQRADSPKMPSATAFRKYEAPQRAASPKMQANITFRDFDASQRAASPEAFFGNDASQRATTPKMPSEAAFRSYANSHRESMKPSAVSQTARGTIVTPPTTDGPRSTRDASTSQGYASADATLTESLMGPPLAASSMKENPSPQRPGRSFFSQDVPASSFRAADSGPSEDASGVDTSRLGEKLARFGRPIDCVIGYRPDTMKSYQGIMELKPTRRLVGEIAFQLDRRILDYVFSYGDASMGGKQKKKRYYGFTLTHIFDKIRAEGKDANGTPDSKKEVGMRYRLEYVLKNLSPLGYILEFHSQFSQEMVNKYGLLSSPPERKTLDNFGLEDPRVLRMLVSKLMIYDDELKNTLVLLDCLCLLAHDDGGPLFKW